MKKLVYLFTKINKKQKTKIHPIIIKAKNDISIKRQELLYKSLIFGKLFNIPKTIIKQIKIGD